MRQQQLMRQRILRSQWQADRLPKVMTGSEVFPIGGIYLSVDETDPATLFGYGTWAQIATGRMLVGVDTSEPDFETPELTGGEKTHTLTAAEVP